MDDERYRFHRSDVPALLFLLTPIMGLALRADVPWYGLAMLFWGAMAVWMGYSVRVKK